MALENKFKVAISTDFMDSFARIPQKQQAKVSKFLAEFRKNPTGSGYNYERINNAANSNYRSVRIDQTYRGIVLKPDKGNIYMLMWVDHHDKAYEWAERKVVNINPNTGSIQVYTVDESIAKATDEIKNTEEKNDLFKDTKDKHLIQLGVPELLLPVVRNILTEENLDEAAPHLPREATDALYLLAAGFSVEETFKEMEKIEDANVEEIVDTEDFEAALENIDSMSSFFVVEDDETLLEILNAPLDKWRVFLHPSQRKLVEKENYNGPARVLGGAGTGKTVVAMHRAKKLAEDIFNNPGDRILFTTYTKNLAEDIFENLKKICSQETLKRIDVINLDSWVSNFLKKHNWSFDFLFDTNRQYWENALHIKTEDIDLPDTFFKDEWNYVIQANGIKSLQDYFKVKRIGRGRRLSRLDKKNIWPVFEEYRAQLNKNNKKEFIDAIRDAIAILDDKGGVLTYKAIIVDESQDMSAPAFELIRRLVPEGQNDIFIVGDAHQRIYGHKVTLSKCGINIRGRARKLRINYRTTDEIRKWAVALLEGRDIDDLDDGKDDNKGYRSLLHGEQPDIQIFDCYEKEIAHIKNHLSSLQGSGVDLRTICLVTRKTSLRDQYKKSLEASGFETYTIESSATDKNKHSGVRVATMHRVKGLEFDYVIISAVQEGEVPLIYKDIDSEGNELAIEEHETKERSLLYVAATRAKKEVLITCGGRPSRFLV